MQQSPRSRGIDIETIYLSQAKRVLLSINGQVFGGPLKSLNSMHLVSMKNAGDYTYLVFF